MTKKQFINQLGYHLSVLTIEERSEIISFYEDRFNNAIYEGKSEEDVILELETPEEIAKNVLTEYGIQKRVKEQRIEPASIIGLVFFDLLIASWLIPVLVTVSGAIAVSWFSYFSTFSAFFNFGFGAAIGTFVIATGAFAAYLVFIIYFVAMAIKVVLSIFTWHVKVLSGNRNIALVEKLDSFNLFNELAKVKITHKLLAIVAVAGLAVSITTSVVWRGISKSEVTQVDSVVEVNRFEVNSLTDYSLSTELNNAGIEVVYGTTDEIVVTHHNRDEANVTYTETTNGLIIKDESTNGLFVDFNGLSFLVDFLNRDFNFEHSQMIIEVPIGIDFAELDITTANGEIEIEGMEATIVDVMTTNGEITLTDLETVSLKTVTVNGQITVDNVFADTVYIESVNGEITLNDINDAVLDGAEIVVELVNGQIEITDAYFKRIRVDNVNGDISYYNSDHSYIADSVSLETVNGSESHNINH